MARQVHEIMNRELFSVEPEAPREDVLDFLLGLEITACPVVDEAGKLMGTVSLRDLHTQDAGNHVRDCMGEPATTINEDASIEDAARKLAEYGAHRLIALDAKQRPVGMVSAVDLVAALVGVPVRHPQAFPHVDGVAKVPWSDDLPLDSEHTDGVPDGPGVLVLVYGERGRRETPVWVEEAQSLHARVDAMVSGAVEDERFTRLLERSRLYLRFRTTCIDDADTRGRVVDRLCADVEAHRLARAR